MAVTVSLYNHTVKKLVNKEVAYTTLRVMLLSNTATFDATHTALTTVTNAGAYELAGNGWTTGGMTIANVALTTVTTNDAKLDGDDISVTATGGPIPTAAAYKAVIYDDTEINDMPLLWIDFGQDEQAGEDTDFKIVWPAAGIVTFTYT